MHETVDAPLALGLDLGGTSVKWGLVTPDGRIVEQGIEKVEDRSFNHVTEILAGIINNARNSAGKRLVAVGLGSPGLVGPERRVIRTTPNFPWQDVPLVSELEKATNGIPIILENDANLLVYSETRWGAAQGFENVIVLTLGTGVGGGIMVNGNLLRGTSGGAAELGHIPLDHNGPRCGCGSTGCLEVFCNIAGTMRAAAEIYAPDQSPTDPHELADAANAGDERAIKTWERIGELLGIGIAAYVNIFNPQVIIIGGGLTGAGDHLFVPALRMAEKRSYVPSWKDVVVRRAGLEERAGLYGAAVMAFEAAGVQTLPKTEA